MPRATYDNDRCFGRANHISSWAYNDSIDLFGRFRSRERVLTRCPHHRCSAHRRLRFERDDAGRPGGVSIAGDVLAEFFFDALTFIANAVRADFACFVTDDPGGAVDESSVAVAFFGLGFASADDANAGRRRALGSNGVELTWIPVEPTAQQKYLPGLEARVALRLGRGRPRPRGAA